jgi:hypothetical protein
MYGAFLVFYESTFFVCLSAHPIVTFKGLIKAGV